MQAQLKVPFSENLFALKRSLQAGMPALPGRSAYSRCRVELKVRPSFEFLIHL
jgi:hypothetical protein